MIIAKHFLFLLFPLKRLHQPENILLSVSYNRLQGIRPNNGVEVEGTPDEVIRRIRQKKLEGTGRRASNVKSDAMHVGFLPINYNFLNVTCPAIVDADELESLVPEGFKGLVVVNGVVGEVYTAIEGFYEPKVKPTGVWWYIGEE